MANQTVVIISGDPTPDPVPDPGSDLLAGDLITFTNNDPMDYLLEFQRKRNTNHDPICVLVPAGQSTTLMADPNDSNVTCAYRILDTKGNPVGIKKSSGHSIIVGSGSTPGTNKAKRKKEDGPREKKKQRSKKNKK